MVNMLKVISPLNHERIDMATFDMGNMPLDEFCKRLSNYPEQDKEINADLLKEIFPECDVFVDKDSEIKKGRAE